MPLVLLFFLFVNTLFAQSLPIPREDSGRVRKVFWNGSTPLHLPKSSELASVFLIQDGKEIPFLKQIATNFEEEVYRFSLASTPNPHSPASLKIKDPTSSFFYRNTSAPIVWQHAIPKLEIITLSKSITRGGVATAVVSSENRKELHFLAFIDEAGVPYYPNTFKKDGYYVFIFPWYVTHSKTWTKPQIMAMDKAGNTASISAQELILSSSPRIVAKSKNFLEKQIMLRNDYGTEKAKELNLSPEEAKKIATNITAINAALSTATTRPFERWQATRLSFNRSTANIVKQTSNLFKSSASPVLEGSRTTTTFGDQRRYFFRNKKVRESTHMGVDLAKIKNMPIYSILDGTVIYTDWHRGNGRTVVIDHGLGIFSFYAHTEAFTIKEGQKVKAGQQIAISGTTGQSTGDHLHISIIVQGMYVEPKEWLNHQRIIAQVISPILEAERIIDSKIKSGSEQAPVLLSKLYLPINMTNKNISKISKKPL